MRDLVREREVRLASLVQPLFVADAGQPRGEIASMPGIFRYDVDGAVAECAELAALGIRAVLLFGIPDFKDAARIVRARSERCRRARDRGDQRGAT